MFCFDLKIAVDQFPAELTAGLIKRFYHPRSLVMQPSKRIKKTTKTNLMDKDYNFHKTQLKEIETTSTNCDRSELRSLAKVNLVPYCCRIVPVSIIYPPLSGYFQLSLSFVTQVGPIVTTNQPGQKIDNV